jgi:hypothetical protein
MQCSDRLKTAPVSRAFIRDRWLIHPANLLFQAFRLGFSLKDSAGLSLLFTMERQQVEERPETIENNVSRQTNYLHKGGNFAIDEAIGVGVISA